MLHATREPIDLGREIDRDAIPFAFIEPSVNIFSQIEREDFIARVAPEEIDASISIRLCKHEV